MGYRRVAIVGIVGDPAKRGNARRNGQLVLDHLGQFVGEFLGDMRGGWKYLPKIGWGVPRGKWRLTSGGKGILDVESASWLHPGLRQALSELVAVYPEMMNYTLVFDRLRLPISALLHPPPPLGEVVFYHGTSSTAIPSILNRGICPRWITGSPAVFGAGKEHVKPARVDAVYLSADPGPARAASRDARKTLGGTPVIVSVTGLDLERFVPDEDSGATTWEESLYWSGCVAHVGCVPPDQILGVEDVL